VTLFATTVLAQAGVLENSATGTVASGRADTLTQVQAAEDAVLRPVDTGRWSHEMRAALASRIANLNAEPALANRFRAGAGAMASLADPAVVGDTNDLVTVLAFMDKVAMAVRDVVADDIASLQAAGIGDADIVRLCELNAFLAFQIRVCVGLRLMRDTSA